MDASVIVIEPVDVAALGNGNDIVDLIVAGSTATSATTPTASFPFPSAATITLAATHTITNTATSTFRLEM